MFIACFMAYSIDWHHKGKVNDEYITLKRVSERYLIWYNMENQTLMALWEAIYGLQLTHGNISE